MHHLRAMSPAWRLLVVAAVAVPALVGGCAESLGRQSARGAIQTIERRVEDDPAVRSAARAGGAEVVTGALSELTSPENQASIEQIAAVAAAAAAHGLATSLRESDGAMLAQVADRAAAGVVAGLSTTFAPDTALRTDLANATRELSASVVAGAREQLLFPACAGPDRQACVERHLADLSRAAARGAAAGIADTAMVPMIVLAFLAGVLATVLLVRTRRRPPPAAGPAPGLRGAHGVAT